MSANNPFTYLSRHNVFYFRVVVLIQNGDADCRQEYRRSLRTRDPSAARKMTRVLMTCVDKVCDGGGINLATWETLKKILDDHLVQLIAKARERIADKGPYSISTEDVWEGKLIPNYEKHADEVSRKRFEQLIGKDVHLAIHHHLDPDRILKEHGIADLKDNPDLYMQFCEYALRMLAVAYERKLDLNKEVKTFHAGSFTPGQEPQVPSSSNTQQESIDLLSEVAKKYRNELMAGENWTEKTHGEYQSAHDLLIEILNDRSITTVDSKAAQFFKATLQELPKNRTTKPQYKGKSIDQLRKMKIPDEHRLSIPSVNKYIGMASYLMNWAVKNGYTTSNPFAGIKLKENKQAQDKKLPFSNNDLVALFSSLIYLDCKCKHGYYYWLPLIALYTGARIDEICQLHLDDIHQVDGVWVFDINDKDEKKLKTLSSKRLVPIHSRLIELGLIKYHKALLKQGEERLFPELKKGKDGYSTQAGRWFNDRHRKTMGVNGKDKTFHSFRHTMTNQLKQKGNTLSHVGALTGHQDESITFGLYGSAYEPNVLLPVIEQLTFPIKPKPFM